MQRGGVQQRRPPLYLLTNVGCSHPHPLRGEGRRKRERKKIIPVRPLRLKSLKSDKVPKL